MGNHTPHQAVRSDARGVHGPLPLYFFLERYQESYVAEMKSFIEAVVQNSPPLAGGSDGRRAVVLGLAAWKSYRENRPVRVDDDA